MHEIGQQDAEAFLARWGAFHDAVVHGVEFDLAGSTVSVTLQAYDTTADWSSCDVRILVEGLSEFGFRQAANYDVSVVFEAGIVWDGATVLLTLDAGSAGGPAAVRASDTYFGGTRLTYDAQPVV